MNHPELLRLMEAHDQATQAVHAQAIAVWVALQNAEPELASEILGLFSTVDAAAHWVAASVDEAGISPAKHVAEGRSAAVVSRLRQASHGIVG